MHLNNFMKFLETPHKKKSAGLTAMMAILLMLLFFVMGLTYYDPPISYGMEVSFGNLNQGNGDVPPQKNTASKLSELKNQSITQKVSNQSSKEEIQKQVKEVMTEKKSPVSILKKENIKQEIQPTIKKEKKIKESTSEKVKPKVSDITKSVVSNLLKNNKQKSKEIEGKGDEEVDGDKGKSEGDFYSSSYYNNVGLGGIGKSYGLNGRNLQSNGKVVQECNQEGTVVVRITVNKNGNVVNAEPGVKGSTNTHPCLLSPAKKTALLHKWFPDEEAPEQQVGFVLIQFKLGE